MVAETLVILDGTVLVLRPYFVGVEAPWAAARAAVRRAMPASSHLAVVIDRTMDTFRRELDPAYKAHRPPAPPELIAHFNRFEEEVAALGVPVFGSLRYEADDMAASLARQATAQGLSVHIHSDDKDLFQIVQEAPLPPVVLEDTRRQIRYDRAMVREKLGVWPEQVVDYLSLVGDSVDGIPGVKGVGAKTAAALIDHFGSLDALYADLGAVAGLSIRGARTLPDKLRAGHATALHARTLIRLVQDADLGDDPMKRCLRPV